MAYVHFSFFPTYLKHPIPSNQSIDSDSQELFITRVTKTIQKKNVLSKRKKRGWFTKEQMSRVLNWSGQLGMG